MIREIGLFLTFIMDWTPLILTPRDCHKNTPADYFRGLSAHKDPAGD
jgi:hypothetical protein